MAGSPYPVRVNSYRYNGTNWVDDSVVSGQMSTGFGWAVALREGRLAVGAPSDSTMQSGAGAALVYLRSGTSWVWEAALLPPPTSPASKLTGSYYGHRWASPGTSA